MCIVAQQLLLVLNELKLPFMRSSTYYHLDLAKVSVV